MPTGGVTRENAGDWIRAGAVRHRRRHGAGRRRRPWRSGDSTPSRPARAHFVDAVRPRAPAPVRREAMAMKTVCFGEIMLRLSPPGFERLLPVAARCRPPSAAARPTSPSAWRTSASTATTSRACPPIRSATPRSGRCAPKASTSITSCAAARGSASTSRRPARASARRRSSTTAPTRRSASSTPGVVPWDDVFAGAGVVPLHRHHAGARRHRRVHARAKRSRPRRRAGARVSVDLNFRTQAVVRDAGAGGDAPADAAASTW